MSRWVEGIVVENLRWTEDLFSLRFDAPIAGFEAGQFTRVGLDIDGERVTRPYSFVNPPQHRPFEIYFNLVSGGPLSPRLGALTAGSRLWVSDLAAGFFTVGELPPARDLWLIATGTALGVYLSILRTDAPWRKFENLVLVHGVRRARELTYRDEISRLRELRGARFRSVSAVSRERPEGHLHGRITHLFDDGRLEAAVGLVPSPKHAHIMLCGNAGMIRDLSAMLAQRGLRRHRRREPGHITTERYH